MSRYHWTVNLLYWLECRAGELWAVAAHGRATCWLDWLTALAYRMRKAAEKRHPLTD